MLFKLLCSVLAVAASFRAGVLMFKDDDEGNRKAIAYGFLGFIFALLAIAWGTR